MCDYIKDLLSSYIDGETDDDERVLIEEHLDDCEDCRNLLNEYKNIIASLNNLPDEELPEGYCKRLHEKLSNAKEHFNEDNSTVILKDSEIKDSEKKHKNNLIRYGSLAAALAIIIISVSIGNMTGGFKLSKNSNNLNATEAPQAAPYPSEMDSAVRGKDENYIMKEENRQAADTGFNDMKIMAAMISDNRKMKVIKNGSIYAETVNYDNFLSELNAKIDSLGGFIENNNTEVYQAYNSSKLMRGNLKLRVPQENFYELIDYLESFAEVKRKNLSEDDVTKEYYEKDNQVKNLELQEQHLRDLFDRAQTVEEILQIENELRRIRTEIDSLNLSLADIDDRASMSTINLDVEEVEAVNFKLGGEKSIWDRAKDGFIGTINSIVKGFGDFTVYAVSVSPVIIPALAVFAVLLLKVRKYRKQKNLK